MRKYLIVTAILSAVLMGLMLYFVQLINERDAVVRNIYSQSQQAEAKKEQLKQKEELLAQLQEQIETSNEDQEWLALQEDVRQLEAQKAELESQIQQFAADTAALEGKLQNEDNDQSYFLEVYNALAKGLNDVKGYLSGD